MSESKIQMTRAEFMKIVAKVMKSIAKKHNHVFVSPKGINNYPYDVCSFEGWAELCDELRLVDPEPCEHLSIFHDKTPYEQIFRCQNCGKKLKPNWQEVD